MSTANLVKLRHQLLSSVVKNWKVPNAENQVRATLLIQNCEFGDTGEIMMKLVALQIEVLELDWYAHLLKLVNAELVTAVAP